MDKELTTASAVIDLHKVSFKIGCALLKYNSLRENDDYYAAHIEALATIPDVARIVRGLMLISHRGLYRMAKASKSGICMAYIKEKAPWNLMQLFYWNGCPELTVKILNLAWKKGIKKC